MRFLRLLIASTALMFAATGAYAAEPKQGVEYTVLDTPVRTEAPGKKVEVVEFFMYTCPHCNALEPHISAWVKQNADKIYFRRIHFARNEKDLLARAYVTLETMGTPDIASQKLFDAIHKEHKRLMREEDVTAIVVSAGVDKAKYESVYKSFGVESKMKRIGSQISQYKVEFAPTLVIDGRYMTSPSQAGHPGEPEEQSQKAALVVADYLVNKAAAAKK